RQPRERLLLRHHRDLPAGPDALHVSAGLDARLSRCPGAGATTSSCPAPVPPPMTGLDARSSVPPPDPERRRAADLAVRPPQRRAGSRGPHPGHVPHSPPPAHPPRLRRPERVGPPRHPAPDRCLHPTVRVRPAVRHPVPAVPLAPVLG